MTVEHEHDLLASQEVDLDALRRIERRLALNGVASANVSGVPTAELLNSMHEQSAANPQSEAPPEERRIDLTARRQELFDAHAIALHQLHYLEGALNEIDYLLELTTPQPANTAEGEK